VVGLFVSVPLPQLSSLTRLPGLVDKGDNICCSSKLWQREVKENNGESSSMGMVSCAGWRKRDVVGRETDWWLV
jgi:hypothetical protein